MPFTGNFLKGIVCYLAGAFLFPRWIKPIRNLLFCGNAGGAGFLERKLGVCAKGKQFFAALKAIFYAPAFCASWRNEKEQAVAVKQLLRFFEWLGNANGGIGKRHRGILLARGFTTLEIPLNLTGGYAF